MKAASFTVAALSEVYLLHDEDCSMANIIDTLHDIDGRGSSSRLSFWEENEVVLCGGGM